MKWQKMQFYEFPLSTKLKDLNLYFISTHTIKHLYKES